jgi:hypothetical protein
MWHTITGFRKHEKNICFTIDIEPDFSGLLKKDVYYGRQNLLKLENIVKKNDIKLTAFVTGKTLEDNPEILSFLEAMKAEIECHSYAHKVDHGTKIEERGIRTFEKLVGRLPYGYRAPEGIITKKEALFLDSKGIKFDSSISPALLPGRYNHLNFSVQPFKITGSNLLELPLPVVPMLRIPFNFSFVQLLGFGTFSLLLRIFGWPNLLIFNIHAFELGRIHLTMNCRWAREQYTLGPREYTKIQRKILIGLFDICQKKDTKKNTC